MIDENINSNEFKYLKNNYNISKEYRSSNLAAFRQITILFRKRGYNSSTINSIKKIGHNFIVFDLKSKKS